MCDFIDSACLLANLFVTCKERDSFPLQDVKRIGTAVQQRLRGKNVMVVWTRPSVLAAFHNYSDMFQLQERVVFRAQAAEDLFSDEFVGAEFNADLPDSVVREMREEIISSCAFA